MGIIGKVKNIFTTPGENGNGEFKVPFEYDMHSHLLPGIDDGVKSIDEAVSICLEMEKAGYRKLITTPHIMGDFFRNSPDNILPLRDQLQEALIKENSNLEIHASGEYYLDEWFPEKIKNNELLPFLDNYILVETPFLNKHSGFREMIFELQTKGYKPILAHPERYTFVKSSEEYQEWVDMGILLQVNITSLARNYSPQVRQNAKTLIKKKLVHFAGTDIHNQKHMRLFYSALKQNAFKELKELDLLNNKKVQ